MEMKANERKFKENEREMKGNERKFKENEKKNEMEMKGK